LLRHIIGSMKPTSGSVKIFGEEITSMNEREITSVRQRFGMLFQSGALLASLTVGENVALPFTLKVASMVETIEVVSATPLVDIKKRGTSTTMVSDELEKTPNSRDPWGVLKNVPGVVVDRVNIAGNNNGQFVIQSVTATTLTLFAANQVTAEGPEVKIFLEKNFDEKRVPIARFWERLFNTIAFQFQWDVAGSEAAQQLRSGRKQRDRVFGGERG
jgi:ABC-type sugar transport system ATPase subunit